MLIRRFSKPAFPHPTLTAIALALVATLATTVFAQVSKPDPAKTKSSESLRIIFKDIVAAADKSTVIIQADTAKDQKNQVALGTVVGQDGFILTKASEVIARNNLTVIIAGKSLPAKLVGVSGRQDLAMLKVDATGLTVIAWADTKTNKVDVGEWVASASAGVKDEPFAVGVVSVGRRRIRGVNGFLGVELADGDGTGAKIRGVLPRSAAETAGVKADDIITAVNGKPTKDSEALSDIIHTFDPGDVITLSVKRGDTTLELKADLGEIGSVEPSRYNMMNVMSGPVSKRSSDFPAVFQHDTVIRPNDCGGPLVDLSGKAIGINIARAGRTETYALPADIILPLIDPLKSGKLAPVSAPAQPAEKPATLPAATKPAATKPAHGE